MYKNPSGKRKHDHSNDCPNYRLCHQYHIGCDLDLWGRTDAGSWDYGSRNRYVDWTMGAMFITLFAVTKKHSLRGKFKQNACEQIYANGIGSIVTQSLYTLYIVGLNMILKLFTEDAVTVLGIYYKIQSFFFIPLLGFQQVLLPLFSYHYGAGDNRRNREILKCSIVVSVSIMAVATGIFFVFPEKLIQIFST